MKSEQKQQTARNILRELNLQSDQAATLASFAERYIRMDGPQAAVLDELIHWALSIRDVCKQGGVTPDIPVSRLLACFQHIAQQKGIDPERFYAVLAEKMFLDTETDESSRCPSKHSTKEKVLDAALEVFSEKGFHLATVEEIAERAAVGKGTLYRYFANKETLFRELIRLRLEELDRSAQAVLDGQDDVLTMITKYVRTYFEFFDRNQRLYRLIVQERLDVGDQVQDLYVKKVMRRIPLLKRKIYGASQQGILKEVDFQTVFYGVMGFIHGVIQKWLARDCSYSLVDEVPTVVEVLFYGFVKTAR